MALPLKSAHHPVVLAEQAKRASDIQLRIADWITSFAGSMNFVYLHVVGFTVWMLFIEGKPLADGSRPRCTGGWSRTPRAPVAERHEHGRILGQNPGPAARPRRGVTGPQAASAGTGSPRAAPYGTGRDIGMDRLAPLSLRVGRRRPPCPPEARPKSLVNALFLRASGMTARQRSPVTAGPPDRARCCARPGARKPASA